MNRLLLTCTRRMPQYSNYQFYQFYNSGPAYRGNRKEHRNAEKDRKAMKELKIHVERINKIQIIRDELKPSDIEETVEISTEIGNIYPQGYKLDSTNGRKNINIEEVHINRSVWSYYDLAEKIPCMRGKIDPVYVNTYDQWNIAETLQYTGTTFDLKRIAYLQGYKMIGSFKTTLINENSVRRSGIVIRNKIKESIFLL